MIKYHCDICHHETEEESHQIIISSKWKVEKKEQLEDPSDAMNMFRDIFRSRRSSSYGKEFRLCDSCFVKIYEFLTKQLPKDTTIIKRT